MYLSVDARATASHSADVQQNGIPEEAELVTATQTQASSNQEFSYEPSVDHVTSEAIPDEVEAEQFTPSEVESKSKPMFPYVQLLTCLLTGG